MNIVYLIGNGFDIAQEYPTSYQDFYKWIAKRPLVNELQKRMLDEIQSNTTQNWSDLESALGVFASNTDDKELFEEFYLHIIRELKLYLCEIENSFIINESIQKKYFRDIVTPAFYLTSREQIDFESFYRSHRNEGRNIQVISFNYTRIFEKIFAEASSPNALPTHGSTYKFKGIIKLHGACNSTILMGVDNESQILNPIFAKDEDVHDYFIKPKINQQLGNLNDDIATKILNSADLIVTMGLSFGNTDRTWWRIVGRRIQNNPQTKVIINYFYKEELPTNLLEPRVRRCVKKEFLQQCGLERSMAELYMNNVYVAVNKGFLQPNYFIADDENRKGQ